MIPPSYPHQEISFEKLFPRKAILTALLCFWGGSAPALPVPRAGAILEVDFGTTELGKGEDRFSTFKLISTGKVGPQVKTFGDFSVRVAIGSTVDLSGKLNASGTLVTRDRTVPSADTGTFSYDKLYRDFVTGGPLAVQIAGLQPSTAYTVAFYAYDNSTPGNVAFVNMTGATAALPNGANSPLGSRVWSASSAFTGTTPNDVHALTARIVSDSQGRITVRQSGAGNCLNGVRVFGPPTLAVDFGQSQNPSLVESGFQEFEISNYPGASGPVAQSYENGTVRIAASAAVDAGGVLNGAGTFLGRDRGQPASDAGEFLFNDLYRDFVTTNSATMGIQISGLAPETPYDVQFYYFDHYYTRTASFTNITGATPALPNGVNQGVGSITSLAGHLFTGTTSNEAFALSVRATTDASGRLTFKQQNANGATLNGLAVWAPPAKPAIPPTRQGFFAGGRDYFPNLRAAEDWLGKPATASVDFMETKEWPSGTISWTGFDHGIDYVTNGTASWPATRWAVAYTIPLIIYKRDTNAFFGTVLADVAAGNHLDHFERLGEKLVEWNEADAYIRLSHEMNGGWYNWSVTDAATAAAFRGAWIRVVERMRSVAGQRFRFDFNPAALGITQSYPLYPEAWPGAYHVSCVGIDVYDASDSPAGVHGDFRWAELLGTDDPASQGLLFWTNMAAARGLPISFPEWATGMAGSGWSGGDSPYFIRKMHQWISTHDVAYHCYWDSNSRHDGKLSDNSKPKAGAVYRELFGREEYSSEDVGAVGLGGSATYNSSLKQYGLESAGAGLGGTSDALHFLRTLKSGDFLYQARLVSISNTNANAFGGIMIRETEAADARFIFAGVTQGGTAFVKFRASPGAAVQTSHSVASGSPRYFRLTRTGSSFAAYQSADGLSWTVMGSAQTISMAAETMAGIASSSTNPGQLNLALFDNVNEPIEIVVDSEVPGSGGSVAFSGTWSTATGGGIHGANSRTDGNTGKSESKHVTFTPQVAESGAYNVYIWHAMAAGNATNVPVVISHAGGTTTRTINQQHEGSDWHMLGTFTFTAGAGHSIKVCTKTPGGGANTNGTVHADAVRLWRARE